MAGRERYTFHCECKKHGLSGTGTAEEEENPVYRGRQVEYLSLPDGFVVKGDRVVCRKCEQEKR